MATVNFSVPEEVKREFNEEFEGENKSAVIARLMKQAVAERRRQARRAVAVEQLLALRDSQEPVEASQVQEAREEYRS